MLDKGQGIVGFIAQVGVLYVPAKLTIYNVFQGILQRGQHLGGSHGCCTVPGLG